MRRAQNCPCSQHTHSSGVIVHETTPFNATGARRGPATPGQRLGLTATQEWVQGMGIRAIHVELIHHIELKPKLVESCLTLLFRTTGRLPTKLHVISGCQSELKRVMYCLSTGRNIEHCKTKNHQAAVSRGCDGNPKSKSIPGCMEMLPG